LPEQHWLSTLHPAPDARQQRLTPPSATQVPAPAQHCVSSAQAKPAAEQQRPKTQSAFALPRQHSLSMTQRSPGGEHWQTPASQPPLQHWVLSVQLVEERRQHAPAAHVPEQQFPKLPVQALGSGRQQEPPEPHDVPEQHRVGLEVQLKPSVVQQRPSHALVVHWVPASHEAPSVCTQREPEQIPASQQSELRPQLVPGARQAPHWLVVPRQRSSPQHSPLPEEVKHVEPVVRQHSPLPPSGRGGSHCRPAQQSTAAAHRSEVELRQVA
jgi:hypothetical protein